MDFGGFASYYPGLGMLSAHPEKKIPTLGKRTFVAFSSDSSSLGEASICELQHIAGKGCLCAELTFSLLLWKRERRDRGPRRSNNVLSRSFLRAINMFHYNISFMQQGNAAKKRTEK